MVQDPLLVVTIYMWLQSKCWYLCNQFDHKWKKQMQMKQPTSWKRVSRIKWRHDVRLGCGIMTLYLCTKTVTISSRGGPPNLSNFLETIIDPPIKSFSIWWWLLERQRTKILIFFFALLDYPKIRTVPEYRTVPAVGYIETRTDTRSHPGPPTNDTYPRLKELHSTVQEQIEARHRQIEPPSQEPHTPQQEAVVLVSTSFTVSPAINTSTVVNRVIMRQT